MKAHAIHKPPGTVTVRTACGKPVGRLLVVGELDDDDGPVTCSLCLRQVGAFGRMYPGKVGAWAMDGYHYRNADGR